MRQKLILAFLTTLSFLMIFLSERPFSFALPLWILFITLSVCDLRSYRLPNFLNAAVLGLGIWFNIYIGQNHWIPVTSFLIALISLGAISYLYHKKRGHHGMGLGDIKLFAAGAVWIVPIHLPFVLLISSTTAILGTILTSKKESLNGKKAKIPFGPYLASALWIVWLFETELNRLF